MLGIKTFDFKKAEVTKDGMLVRGVTVIPADMVLMPRDTERPLCIWGVAPGESGDLWVYEVEPCSTAAKDERFGQLSSLVNDGFAGRDLLCVLVRGERGVGISCGRTRAEVAEGLVRMPHDAVGMIKRVWVYVGSEAATTPH